MSNALSDNVKYFPNDNGILSIMYHRFDENKYPSTNVRMNIFKEQIKYIFESKYNFYNPKNIIKDFYQEKSEKKILLTIDDAFLSFYENAWPFLKQNKIPFILFVSTEPVGKNGYMNWEQILEIEKEPFVFIGHHSHTHEYLINFSKENFIKDIKLADKIFLEKLGYVPKFFSYPFGEYDLFMRNYISENFKIAFGQHSGVIDASKDIFELPRFPINENYGELNRFKSIIKLYPLQYKNISPKEKKITNSNNPPDLKVEFFDDQKNIKNINCFSNDGGNWKKTDLLIENNVIKINLKEKFIPRRGRINCSLNDNGKWRWFGIQYTLKLD